MGAYNLYYLKPKRLRYKYRHQFAHPLRLQYRHRRRTNRLHSSLVFDFVCYTPRTNYPNRELQLRALFDNCRWFHLAIHSYCFPKVPLLLPHNHQQLLHRPPCKNHLKGERAAQQCLTHRCRPLYPKCKLAPDFVCYTPNLNQSNLILTLFHGYERAELPRYKLTAERNLSYRDLWWLLCKVQLTYPFRQQLPHKHLLLPNYRQRLQDLATPRYTLHPC